MKNIIISMIIFVSVICILFLSSFTPILYHTQSSVHESPKMYSNNYTAICDNFNYKTCLPTKCFNYNTLYLQKKFQISAKRFVVTVAPDANGGESSVIIMSRLNNISEVLSVLPGRTITKTFRIDIADDIIIEIRATLAGKATKGNACVGY